MEISREKLAALLSEAFDRGMSGCAELKQQDMEELFAKISVKDAEDFRIWRQDELHRKPEGSIFHHLLRGRCWIVQRANGAKFMQFETGQAIDFNSNSDPWDKPMRLIHSVE